jgi:hypothetical protein
MCKSFLHSGHCKYDIGVTRCKILFQEVSNNRDRKNDIRDINMVLENGCTAVCSRGTGHTVGSILLELQKCNLYTQIRILQKDRSYVILDAIKVMCI